MRVNGVHRESEIHGKEWTDIAKERAAQRCLELFQHAEQTRAKATRKARLHLAFAAMAGAVLSLIAILAWRALA